jgi:hypothetical protein
LTVLQLSDVPLSLFAKPMDNRIPAISQFNRPDLPFNFAHLAILQAFVFAAQHLSASNGYRLFALVVQIVEATGQNMLGVILGFVSIVEHDFVALPFFVRANAPDLNFVAFIRHLAPLLNQKRFLYRPYIAHRYAKFS